MPILIKCEHCQQKLNAPESMLDKRIRCPKCKSICLVRPAAATAKPAPTPAEPPKPAPRPVEAKKPAAPPPVVFEEDLEPLEEAVQSAERETLGG